MSQDLKATLRRVFEQGINEGDASVIEELIGANYVNHDLPAPGPGPVGFSDAIGMFRQGFPDLRVNLEAVFADGDLVGSRGSFNGTHQGEFMGVPATGKEVTVKYMDLWRAEDGKLVENWVRMDFLGLMQQLGVMPAGPA
jgi:predicted ester cyclase